MNETKRGAWFCAAVAALALANVAASMPANTGSVHPAEWVAFYGAPPVFYAAIFSGIAYALQRRSIARGERDAVRLPYLGILFWVAVLLVAGFTGR